jgi:prepilin-type N-terminal cleavage/methylation domain-containing protein
MNRCLVNSKSGNTRRVGRAPRVPPSNHVQTRWDSLRSAHPTGLFGPVMDDTGRRHGFSLLELTVSVGISSILMVGMGSALFVSLRATEPSTGIAAIAADAHEVVAQMTAELQFAKTIPASSANSITITIEDRTGDAADETIVYAWSGTVGDPLTRQFNGGTVIDMIDSVEVFFLQKMPETGPVKFVLIEVQVTSNADTTIQSAAPLVNTP